MKFINALRRGLNQTRIDSGFAAAAVMLIRLTMFINRSVDSMRRAGV